MLHTIKVRNTHSWRAGDGVEKKLEREAASENVLQGRTEQTNIMHKTLIRRSMCDTQYRMLP